ncbi:MAG: cation diffusion facilitator family transporter [Polyangiaceae bacterium]|jgi:cobalt-zinc-cadmium efflux system protein
MSSPNPGRGAGARGEHGHAHDHGHDHATGSGHEHADHDQREGHEHHGDPHRGQAHVHAHGAGAARGVFTAREARQAKGLATVLAIVATFFGFELAGAILAHSVVLEADALHLLMDVLALAVSLIAMRVAIRRPTPRFTFGMRRAEPVAGIFNAMLVLGATVEIVREGIAELNGGGEPRAGIMLVVAVAALGVNGVSAWLLHGALHDHDHDHDHGHDRPGSTKASGHSLNLRGAWLHLLGDALGSVAALVAAIAIKLGGPVSIDAIASFAVAAILVFSAFRVVRDATLVLLEAAPLHAPVGAVREMISGFAGIAEVHDLHVWTLGAGHDAITAHVRAKAHDPTIARRLSLALREAFETEYVTVQVESPEEECASVDGD